MTRKPTKILLVEDDSAQRKIVTSELNKVKSSVFEVSVAINLKEALSKELISANFDVILLDLNLPDSSEMDTFTSMHDRSNEVPIVIVSSIEDEKMMLEMVKKGAQDYILKKNISSFQLSSSIRFAIERHKLVLDKQKLIIEMDYFTELLKSEITSSLKNQETLIGAENTSVTANMAGVGSLKSRSIVTFDHLVIKYETLIHEYLEALGFNQQPPRRKINLFAKRIGDNGGGPQDVVDIHLKVVHKSTDGINPKRARIITMEGRLLALEVMGNLVDYYRQGVSNIRSES